MAPERVAKVTCGRCGVNIHNKSDLRGHQASKNCGGPLGPDRSVERFLCDVAPCTRSFSCLSNLVRHQKDDHGASGRKVFECPWCAGAERGGSSTRKDNVARHVVKCSRRPADLPAGQKTLGDVAREQGAPVEPHSALAPAPAPTAVVGSSYGPSTYIQSSPAAAQQPFMPMHPHMLGLPSVSAAGPPTWIPQQPSLGALPANFYQGQALAFRPLPPSAPPAFRSSTQGMMAAGDDFLAGLTTQFTPGPHHVFAGPSSQHQYQQAAPPQYAAPAHNLALRPGSNIDNSCMPQMWRPFGLM